MMTSTVVPAAMVSPRKTRSPGRTAAPVMAELTTGGPPAAGVLAAPRVGCWLMGLLGSGGSRTGAPRRPERQRGAPAGRSGGSGRAQRVDGRADLGGQLVRQR